MSSWRNSQIGYLASVFVLFYTHTEIDTTVAFHKFFGSYSSSQTPCDWESIVYNIAIQIIAV